MFQIESLLQEMNLQIGIEFSGKIEKCQNR